MATHAPITGAPTRAPAFLHLRRRLSAEIETHLSRVDLLLARLNRLDGDCDLEPAGDELDGTGAEDDFSPHNASWHAGPGCPISDPGECDTVDDRPIVDEAAYLYNLRRIRRDRCGRQDWPSGSTWFLLDDASPAAWVRP